MLIAGPQTNVPKFAWTLFPTWIASTVLSESSSYPSHYYQPLSSLLKILRYLPGCYNCQSIPTIIHTSFSFSVASTIGHYWVHAFVGWSTWSRILWREAKYAVHGVACRSRLRHPWSCHKQFEEIGRKVWCWVGPKHRYPQSFGYGSRPKLPPSYDLLVLHQRKLFAFIC